MSPRRKNVQIGTHLLTSVDPRMNRGLNVAAALVTRVHENEEDGLNLRVFLDTGADLRHTNIKLVDSAPEDDDSDVEKDVSGTPQVAWFPRS